MPWNGSQGEEGHQRVRAAQFDCCVDFVINFNRLEMLCFGMENLKRRWQGGDDGAQMELVV